MTVARFSIFLLLTSPIIHLSSSSYLSSSLTSVRGDHQGNYTYQSYQRGITCTASKPPLEPRTLTEIQSIIKLAVRTKLKVKAVGSLHSVTDCICTDGLVLNLTHINHFRYDPKTQRATVGVGMLLMDFLERLHERGRAIQSAPTYSAITVGGAVAIASHGSSLIHPASLSDQIFAVTFVDGRGNVRKINATAEDFKAFRVNLGLLGVVYEVVVDTIEQYKLQMLNFPVKDDILFDDNANEVLDLARTHDIFQFWWFPTNKAVVMSAGNRTSTETPGTCETHQISETSKPLSYAFSVGIELMQKARDHLGPHLIQSISKLTLYKSMSGLRTPFFTEADGATPCLPNATGFGHLMMTNACRECAWSQGQFSLTLDDTEIAIPVEQLFPALKTLRKIMDSELAIFPLTGLYIRFLKGSDSYLGTNGGGKDVVSIEWTTNPRFDKTDPKLYLTPSQAMGQALIDKHQGRAHWGKNGLSYFHPNVIERSYAQVEKFREVMRKYDPFQTFMNNFGARIRHGKNQVTATKEMLTHCALTEVCLCQIDRDCGAGGPTDYQCGELFGYRVCKPREEEKDKMTKSVARKVIDKIAATVNNEDSIFSHLRDYKVFKDLLLKEKELHVLKGGVFS